MFIKKLKILDMFGRSDVSVVRGNVTIDSKALEKGSYIKFFNSRYLGSRNIQTGEINFRYFASDVLAVRRDEFVELGGFDTSFKK